MGELNQKEVPETIRFRYKLYRYSLVLYTEHLRPDESVRNIQNSEIGIM